MLCTTTHFGAAVRVAIPQTHRGRPAGYLTATEAESLAVLIEAGEHTTHALASVSPARRDRAAKLLAAARIGHFSPELSVAVLRGIVGAKSVHRDLMPVWTMPGNEASTGRLTNQIHDVVAAARTSVTCATYNFSPISTMWDALKTASEEPEVVVCVYVDAGKGNPAGVKGTAAAGHCVPLGHLVQRTADRPVTRSSSSSTTRSYC